MFPQLSRPSVAPVSPGVFPQNPPPTMTWGRGCPSYSPGKEAWSVVSLSFLICPRCRPWSRPRNLSPLGFPESPSCCCLFYSDPWQCSRDAPRSVLRGHSQKCQGPQGRTLDTQEPSLTVLPILVPLLLEISMCRRSDPEFNQPL